MHFKNVKSVCRKMLEDMTPKIPILCHSVMVTSGPQQLEKPMLSSEIQCPYCQGTKCHVPFEDPAISDKRVWLCADVNCEVYKKKTNVRATHPQGGVKRSLEWPLFCEISGIGDLYHNVKFESIEQAQGKIDYLREFAKNPSGIIFMQGDSGAGKTYACLGLCELFTRTKTNAIFLTQNKMLEKWMVTCHEEKIKFIERVTNCNLLIVDDFGTGEVSPGFMKFFLEIINARMQWISRGTVVTTNLDDKKFSEFCGSALNDRIKTGQKFQFKEKSRRKAKVL